ncbi:Ser-tRNA(Ala) deacylase AlaX [Elusimicrobium simillimum]|uniref:hypothetical protein n=1 Tax=Elusimicrobium simillimum TaxID=3143438 RepID=UPI003C7059FD
MENSNFTPKKDYHAPMHTAEHILNQTMVQTFGCARSKNAHIEKTKSKCDYFLPAAPTQQQLEEVEKKVNEVISQNLPVTERIMPRNEVAKISDISKLPADAGDSLRVIFVGDYDVCPCIGMHVQNTSEIDKFKITTWDYENGRLRLRFKLEPK